MAADALCGGIVSTRRGLLASLWSLVTALTAVSFVVALLFTLSARQDNSNDQYYANNNADGQDPVLAVTSRAMAFAALWTAVLASLLSIFGTVILGWQSPTGEYYTCCARQVHRTTPLALGSFIGALLMFANLTLVCSVLFGEFQIRDYQRDGEQDNAKDAASVSRSSMAFSILCMFLTVLYAGFAALTYSFSQSILEELVDEERYGDSGSSSRVKLPYDGYIGGRFDVRRNTASGFVPTPAAEGTLA